MYKPRPEYDTPEYRAWRYAVFARDKWTCQVSGRKGVPLEAHHILPWAQYPHLRYAVSNGITLEKDFHQKVVTGRENEFVAQFKETVELKQIQKEQSSNRPNKKNRGKKAKPPWKYKFRNPRTRW